MFWTPSDFMIVILLATFILCAWLAGQRTHEQMQPVEMDSEESNQHDSEERFS